MTAAGNRAIAQVPTSYMTLYEDDGAVCVRAGTASTSEVLDLAAACSVSLVIREPEVVAFRLHLSTLALTEDALMPCPASTREQRGAWLRVLPRCDQVIRAIQAFPIADSPHDERWWLYSASGEWRELPREDAGIVLNQPSACAGDTVVLLRGAAGPLRRLILASAPTREKIA